MLLLSVLLKIFEKKLKIKVLLSQQSDKINQEL